MLSFDGQLYAVRTTPGCLRGELRIIPGEEDLCLSVTTNRPIFVCGEKNTDTTTFCTLELLRQDQSGIFQNFSNNLSAIATQVLVGFSTRTRFRFFHLPAYSRMVIYLCPLETFRGQSNVSVTTFDQIIKKANTIRPSSDALEQFHTAMRAVLPWDPEQPWDSEQAGGPESLTNPQRDAIHQSLFDCFTRAPKLETVPLKLTQRHELCKDLVAWGYRQVDQPQSLEMVLEQLHTTRAAISQGCKEALGIGPMEVLRTIRLEHIHQALRHRTIQKTLNLRSIEEIREHYGFRSRGNFAALYKKYFEENPRDTFNASLVEREMATASYRGI